LEKAAAKQEEKDRLSSLKEMKRLKAVVEQGKEDTPAKETEKRTDIAI
jgi:hypothetical protein